MCKSPTEHGAQNPNPGYRTVAILLFTVFLAQCPSVGGSRLSALPIRATGPRMGAIGPFTTSLAWCPSAVGNATLGYRSELAAVAFKDDKWSSFEEDGSEEDELEVVVHRRNDTQMSITIPAYLWCPNGEWPCVLVPEPIEPVTISVYVSCNHFVPLSKPAVVVVNVSFARQTCPDVVVDDLKWVDDPRLLLIQTSANARMHNIPLVSAFDNATTVALIVCELRRKARTQCPEIVKGHETSFVYEMLLGASIGLFMVLNMALYFVYVIASSLLWFWYINLVWPACPLYLSMPFSVGAVLYNLAQVSVVKMVSVIAWTIPVMVRWNHWTHRVALLLFVLPAVLGVRIFGTARTSPDDGVVQLEAVDGMGTVLLRTKTFVFETACSCTPWIVGIVLIVCAIWVPLGIRWTRNYLLRRRGKPDRFLEGNEMVLCRIRECMDIQPTRYEHGHYIATARVRGTQSLKTYKTGATQAEAEGKLNSLLNQMFEVDAFALPELQAGPDGRIHGADGFAGLLYTKMFPPTVVGAALEAYVLLLMGLCSNQNLISIAGVFLQYISRFSLVVQQFETELLLHTGFPAPSSPASRPEFQEFITGALRQTFPRVENNRIEEIEIQGLEDLFDGVKRARDFLVNASASEHTARLVQLFTLVGGGLLMYTEGATLSTWQKIHDSLMNTRLLENVTSIPTTVLNVIMWLVTTGKDMCEHGVSQHLSRTSVASFGANVGFLDIMEKDFANLGSIDDPFILPGENSTTKKMNTQRLERVLHVLNEQATLLSRSNCFVTAKQREYFADVKMKLFKSTQSLRRQLETTPREAPYCWLIFGTSSIGKTSINDMLFTHCCTLMDLPCSEEYIWTMPFSAAYADRLKAWTTCMRMEDLARMKPDFAEVEMTGNFATYMDAASNYDFYPNMADLGSKGNVAFRAKFIGATTNSKDCHSAAYFACASAFMRRFKAVITARVRREFQDTNGGLNPQVVPPTDGYPDWWEFRVERAKLEQNPDRFGNCPEFTVVQDWCDLRTFLRFMGDDVRAHFAAQRNYISTRESLAHCARCRLCKSPFCFDLSTDSDHAAVDQHSKSVGGAASIVPSKQIGDRRTCLCPGGISFEMARAMALTDGSPDIFPPGQDFNPTERGTLRFKNDRGYIDHKENPGGAPEGWGLRWGDKGFGWYEPWLEYLRRNGIVFNEPVYPVAQSYTYILPGFGAVLAAWLLAEYRWLRQLTHAEELDMYLLLARLSFPCLGLLALVMYFFLCGWMLFAHWLGILLCAGVMAALVYVALIPLYYWYRQYSIADEGDKSEMNQILVEEMQARVNPVLAIVGRIVMAVFMSFFLVGGACCGVSHEVSYAACLRVRSWLHLQWLALGVHRRVMAMVQPRPVAALWRSVMRSLPTVGGAVLTCGLLVRVRDYLRSPAGDAFGAALNTFVQPQALLPLEKERVNEYAKTSTNANLPGVGSMALLKEEGMDELESMVKKRMGLIYKSPRTPTSEPVGRILGVQGFFWILNYHVFYALKDATVEIVLNLGPHGTVVGTNICFSSAISTRLANNDVIMVYIPSLPNQGKGIVDFFPETGHNIGGTGKVLIKQPSPDVHDEVHVTVLRQAVSENLLRNLGITETVPVWQAVPTETGKNTLPGHCGSPWLVNVAAPARYTVSKPRSAPCIYGIHLGGKGKEFTFAAPVTCHMLRTMIDSLTVAGSAQGAANFLGIMAEYEPEPEAATPLEIPAKHAVRFLKSASTKYEPTRAQVAILAHVPLSHAGKSEVRDTPFRKFWEQKGFSTDKIAPKLSWECEQHALRTMTNIVNATPDRLVLTAILAYKEFLLKNLDRSKWLGRLGTLSWDEVDNGVPGVTYVDSTNMKTSAGYPYKGSKKHNASCILVDNVPKWIPSAEIHDATIDLDSKVRKGIIPPVYFSAAKKDEPVSERKYEKSRIFVVGSWPFLRVMRKYYLPFVRLAQNEAHIFGSYPGIACQSSEWQDLADRFTTGRRRVYLDGDFKEWDKRLQSLVVMGTFFVQREIMRELGGYSMEDCCAMDMLGLMVAHPRIVYWGLLLGIYGTDPSGQSLTVHTNGQSVIIKLLVAFLMLKPPEIAIGEFFEITFATYGDDNTLGIPYEWREWFNLHTLREKLTVFGDTFTDGEKNDAAAPWKETFGETTFVKRYFVHNGLNLGDRLCCSAPLALSSIHKSLLIHVPSKEITWEEQCGATLTSAVFEMFMHGRAAFEEFRSLALECVEVFKLHACVKILTYDEYHAGWVHRSQNSGTMAYPVSVPITDALEFGPLCLACAATTGDEVDAEPQAGESEITNPEQNVRPFVSVQRLLGRIPWLARGIKATQMLVAGSMEIAAMFGFSNPPVLNPARLTKHQALPGLANPAVGSPMEKVALTTGVELDVAGGPLGFGDRDELAIAHVINRDTYLGQVQWTSGRATGYVLACGFVNPESYIVTNKAVGTTPYNVNVITQTPLCFTSHLFRYWRGTIIVRIRIVGVKNFHKGRLRFTWDPMGIPKTMIEGAIHTSIIEVDGATDVEFPIPFMQPSCWLPTQRSLGVPGTIAAMNTFLTAIPTTVTSATSNGGWRLDVLIPLSSATTAGRMYIIVSTRAGNDCEFAVPAPAPQWMNAVPDTLQGLVEFDDIGPCEELEEVPADSIGRAVEPCIALGSFFERPIMLYSGTWAESGSFTLFKHVLYDYLVMTQVANKIQNFRYLRFNRMHIRLIFNAGAYRYSAGYVTFSPMCTELSTGAANTVSFAGGVIDKDLWSGGDALHMALTQRDHVTFTLPDDSAVELSVPFRWPAEFIDLVGETTTAGPQHLFGTLLARSYFALTTATSAVSDPCGYAVYVWFDGFEVSGPTLRGQMSIETLTPRQREGLEMIYARVDTDDVFDLWFGKLVASTDDVTIEAMIEEALRDRSEWDDIELQMRREEFCVKPLSAMNDESVYFGEKALSFRVLAHRATVYSSLRAASAAVSEVPTSKMVTGVQTIMPRFPEWYGPSVAWSATTGGTRVGDTTGTAFFNFVHTPIYALLAACYVGWRGSIVWRAFASPGNETVHSVSLANALGIPRVFLSREETQVSSPYTGNTQLVCTVSQSALGGLESTTHGGVGVVMGLGIEAAEAVFPHFSRFKYHPGNPRFATNFKYTDEDDDSVEVRVTYKNSVFGSEVLLDQTLLTQAGVDFTCFGFMNIPTVYTLKDAITVTAAPKNTLTPAVVI